MNVVDPVLVTGLPAASSTPAVVRDTVTSPSTVGVIIAV